MSLLACAFLVRLAVILSFPSLHHPDENFQLFEQAHRLAFGYGIVPWEFVTGIRSPVLPAIFAAIFRVSEPLVGGPEGYLIVTRLLLAIFSLAAVAAVYRMARRLSALHAFIAGLVAATWFELVYFADRPLTEAIATTVLLVGLSLASVSEKEFTRPRLMAIGLALGSCLMLRVHLATGLLVAAIWVGRVDLRGRWLPMALGGLIPVALFGVADWIAWGSFFHSYVQAVRVNLVQGVASSYGTAPAGAYAAWLWHQWRYAMPLLEALMIVRARRSAPWLLVAIVIIATHSAIPHKEYRFVFPAFACLIIVASLGSADLLQKARTLVSAAMWRGLIAGAACAWVATSAVLAFAGPFRDEWFRGRGIIESSFALAKKPDLCGVLFYDTPWFDTGGFAYLHRKVALYALDHRRAPGMINSTASFNAVVLKRASVPDFSKHFRLQRCFGSADAGSMCVMTRRGSCVHEMEMNAFLPPNTPVVDARKPDASWTNDPPGRVWRVDTGAGQSVWTRRGNTNVFDATCADRRCIQGTVSILRSGSRVMAQFEGPPAAKTVYLGTVSGTRVSGWYPEGPWQATLGR